jgi:hypothetical protein
MSEIEIDNASITPWLAATLLAAGVLAGAPLQSNLFIERGSVIGVRLELENRSAVVGSLPAQLDYALESPNFVPEQLSDFAARGFERRNRWS